MDLGLTTEVARVVDQSQDAETLARPLLRILHQLTGLDTTYLTEVDEDQDLQHILYSEKFGGVEVPEGLNVPWSDTLCKRALTSGVNMTDDVPNLWPESEAAKKLGLQTYVSVPITDSKNVVVGTLCGASGKRMPQGDEVINVMRLFARLIADQWRRDDMLKAAEERAREAEEELSDRALQLAESEHKLKSPLTVIRGWATLLDDDRESLPFEQRLEAVTRIRTAADRLTIQLDELIEQQRNIATNAPLEIAEFDLVSLLEKVRIELSGMSQKHTIVVDADKPLTIRSNETTLWHVLSHLGENAVKYSPNGGRVSLAAYYTGGEVAISVSDQGPGIPTNVDVFQPFVRGNTETSAGSGLGLHIVQTLVRSLDGEVTAGEAKGGGAEFVVRLPQK